MVGKKNQSALLAKYFSLYKKNPRSRVFAPLAESYRKLGMLEDAYKILREGIRNHPDYPLGFIVLAHCYYDERKYELTYNTLRPIIKKNADNISLQKIFAQACLQLGYLDEALDTFKYLLFMNPKDKYFADQVKRLEDDLHVGHRKLSLEQIIQAPDMQVPDSVKTPNFDDDWVQVDFNLPKKEAASTKLETSITPDSSDDDHWVMEKKPQAKNQPAPSADRIQVRDLDDDFYADEFEGEGDIDEVNAGALASDAPLISHTLIDLYCAQHYYDKAIELLEKILELNPGDLATKEKLGKVLRLRQENLGTASLSDEESGHDELISIIEKKVKSKSPQELKVQESFEKFLMLVRKKSEEYRSL